MKRNRQNLIEDRKALQDAIMRAMSMTPPDEKEVKRLEEHLEDIENYLKETK